MARPKNTIPTERKTFHIPEDISARVELLLANPGTGQVKFGAWSKLVTELLREWVEKKITEHQQETQDEI